MTDPVDCPCCGTPVPYREYPPHLVECYRSTDLRSTFAYSAFWAGLLPVLASAAAVLHFVLYVPGGPDLSRYEAVASTALGVSFPAGYGLEFVLYAAPVGVGLVTVAVARCPGQRYRRGWQPGRVEYEYVLAWVVPVVGPLAYAVGAGRRFVAVRFVREKTVVAVVTATERFDRAKTALEDGRDAEAAMAFEDAAANLELVREDEHFSNDVLEARVGAVERACSLAAGICERPSVEPAATTS